MKSLSKIFATLLVSLFMSCSVLYAQNIDTNRMNRDINIMENVLQEMFKTNVKTSANKVQSSSFSLGSSNSIRGTHLPDYGIIFSIPGRQRQFVHLSDGDKDGYSYVFRYSDSTDESNEVTKESITLRIKEFLREYGSTIGQLQDEDKIMVIYNSNTQSNAVTFFSSSGMKKLTEKLPTISVVINKSDLKEYRSGDISKSDLDERFSVSIVDEGKNEKLDLKVMSNIFETALKDSEKESYQISGDVNYLMLDNFGAIFTFKTNYGNSINLAGAYLVRSLESVKVRLTETNSDSISAKTQKAKEEQEKRNQAEKKAYQGFITNVKEYLVDYGRTLSSVSSDQHILISATISSRVDDIPERVDFQVKKSVLEAMDKGSMSREEAIKQISVREY